MSTSSKKLVIIGGGVIGANIAYYATLKGFKPIILERASTVACAASGKAGGFLAKDWTDKVHPT